MADTPLVPARTRKRLIAITTQVRASGQFEPIEFRLPDSALRVTGVQAQASVMPGQFYERRDAFVVFANPPKDGAVYNATVQMPASKATLNGGTMLLSDVLREQEGGQYDLLALSLGAFDATQHVGFVMAVNDEVPVQAIPVPKGKQVFYAHSRLLGVPKLVDEDGVALKLTVEQNHELAITRYTQSTTIPFGGSSAPPVQPDSLAYLCRVEFPNPLTTGFLTVEGYWNGVYFPGVANRY